jgi:hypothetical protein
MFYPRSFDQECRLLCSVKNNVFILSKSHISGTDGFIIHTATPFVDNRVRHIHALPHYPAGLAPQAADCISAVRNTLAASLF